MAVTHDDSSDGSTLRSFEAETCTPHIALTEKESSNIHGGCDLLKQDCWQHLALLKAGRTINVAAPRHCVLKAETMIEANLVTDRHQSLSMIAASTWQSKWGGRCQQTRYGTLCQCTCHLAVQSTDEVAKEYKGKVQGAHKCKKHCKVNQVLMYTGPGTRTSTLYLKR